MSLDWSNGNAAAGHGPALSRLPGWRPGAGPVQYGPRTAAIIGYLYVGQFLSKKRTAEALAEMVGTRSRQGRSPR